MNIEEKKLLYQENNKVVLSIWEMRYKIMTRFFVTVSALLVAAGYCYKTPELSKWVFVPLAIASMISIVSHLLDGVNTWTARGCYKIGKELEKNMGDGQWIYFMINDGHYNLGSYAQILKFLYVSSSIIFAFLSLVLGVASWQ